MFLLLTFVGYSEFTVLLGLCLIFGAPVLRTMITQAM